MLEAKEEQRKKVAVERMLELFTVLDRDLKNGIFGTKIREENVSCRIYFHPHGAVVM